MKKALLSLLLLSEISLLGMKKKEVDIESLETPIAPPNTPVTTTIYTAEDHEELSEIAIKTYRQMMRYMTLQEEVMKRMQPHLANIIRDSGEHHEGVRTLRRIKSGMLDISAQSENREMQFIRDLIIAADHMALADQGEQLSNSIPRATTVRYSAVSGLVATLLTSLVAILVHFTKNF